MNHGKELTIQAGAKSNSLVGAGFAFIGSIFQNPSPRLKVGGHIYICTRERTGERIMEPA